VAGDVNLETRLLDKVLDAHVNLWTALLTVNGFMVTVFSVVAITVPSVNKGLVALLVLLSAVSVLLLILNFLAVQRHFVSSGQQYAAGELPAPAQRAAEVAAAADSFKAVMGRQQAALWLLASQALVLTAVLACPLR
jgi:hypothetical protein